MFLGKLLILHYPQYIPMDEGRVRALSGNVLFAYELPSPTSSHSSELRSATRSAKDRHVFTHIQRSTHHSSPCLRGLFLFTYSELNHYSKPQCLYCALLRVSWLLHIACRKISIAWKWSSQFAFVFHCWFSLWAKSMRQCMLRRAQVQILGQVKCLWAGFFKV